MQYHKFYLPALTAALAVTAIGCVDDNYDLSDIDTTTQLTVKDLVLPVNISDVTLGDIITYDEDSKIQPIQIGDKSVYALSESGDFNSDDIFINSFTCAKPVLNPTEETLSQVIAANAPRKAAGVNDDFSCTYDIVNMGNSFEYTASDIDPAIEQIYSVTTKPLTFKAHLLAMEVDGKVESITFTDLIIQMPLGLRIDNAKSDGTYDPATGVWKIDRAEVSTGDPYLYAQLVATAVDFRAAGCQISNHAIVFNGEFMVKSGLLTIQPIVINGIPAALPEDLRFRVEYTLNDLVAESFSGKVKYDLDGMNIDPVSLSDIPDFLSEPGTDIRLGNPQIYLSLNNPVGNYNLHYTAGMTLSAIRDNAPTQDFTLDAPLDVTADKGINGPYNYVLSPKNEDLALTGYHWQVFSTLGNLLAAPNASTGLPNSIGIAIVNPGIPSQEVNNFALNTTVPGVKGEYQLIAPLALTDNSTITYSDKTDGWLSEDTEEIEISKLELTATVSNNAPVAVELTAYPLDRDGNEIPGVTVTSSILEANTADQPILIEMNGGPIKGLDGVRYVAHVKGSNSGEALSPSQTIVLSNIKARVSGHYITSF